MAHIHKLRDYDVINKVTHKACPSCERERLMNYNQGVWCRDCQMEVSVEPERHVLLRDHAGHVYKEMAYREFKNVYSDVI